MPNELPKPWKRVWLIFADSSVLGTYRTRKEAARYVALMIQTRAIYTITGPYVLAPKRGSK